MHAGSIEDMKWENVQVGQVLQVKDDELFPADLMCLYTALPDKVTAHILYTLAPVRREMLLYVICHHSRPSDAMQARRAFAVRGSCRMRGLWTFVSTPHVGCVMRCVSYMSTMSDAADLK